MDLGSAATPSLLLLRGDEQGRVAVGGRAVSCGRLFCCSPRSDRRRWIREMDGVVYASRLLGVKWAGT